MQADWVGFSDLDWEQRRLAFAVERPGDELEVDAGMERLFWGEFADTHPIRQAALRGYVGALKISDFAGRRELRRTRFYNEWMRVNECEHALDLSLRSTPNCTLTFHFDRAAGRDFTERDRLVLDLLEPHLARLFENGRRAVGRVLTPREREVLSLVARGLTNAQVAEQLWLAPSTVRKHLENVYAKLGVSTRTAAVARVFGSIDAEAS